MLLAIVFCYLIISALSALYVLHLMKAAPVGWEDEKGFHYGSPFNHHTSASKEEAEEKIIGASTSSVPSNDEKYLLKNNTEKI